MSQKYKRKNNSKEKKRSYNTKKHKKINNIYFRFFYVISLFFIKAFINLTKTLFVNIGKISNKKEKYKNHEVKVFSNRCSIIMVSVIVLSIVFIYLKDSIFYVYPLLTCVVPIMILSEGINADPYNQYKDLSLCNKILKTNAVVFLVIYMILNEKIWFISLSMVLIFIIPLILGNLNKEKNWKNYE